MSTEILVAILGREAVESMTAEQHQALVRDLDARILEDDVLVERLRGVLLASLDQEAAETAP